jgi:glucose dehydrogenase
MSSKAPVPIFKIDAVTGEIVWRTDYDCYTVDGVSGGVQGTTAVGKYELSELVFIPVARTPSRGSGILTALNKQTGQAVWEFETSQYGWSSPVCVYTKEGKGYVVFCTSGGNMYLLDGLTGDVMDTIQLGGNIEASPAVYENTIVVGTRTMKIWGITLT